MQPRASLPHFRLVDKDWNAEFLQARRTHPSGLRVVCPFIKQKTIESLLDGADASPIQVITRFNLADFATGVSDISALRTLLDHGAVVRGIKRLHAKLYIFGDAEAIVTSANLTHAALHSNHEFGCRTSVPGTVAECVNYFDQLWTSAGNDLDATMLDDWETMVKRTRITNPTGTLFDQTDFGADVGNVVVVHPRFADAKPGFVKFFGTASSRAPRTEAVIDTIRSSGSHWACTYPETKRPTSVPDGACMFMARMVKDPNDFMVFGRAIGVKHIHGRDEATPNDLLVRPWKKHWPIYLRVHSGEYVGGTLGNGVSLYQLLDDLGHEAFTSTRRNHRQGTGNTDPRKSVKRQAHVRLTRQALSELNRRFQQVIDRFGRQPEVELNRLDQPSIDISR